MKLFGTGRSSKKALKELLGELPLTAEVYGRLRPTGKPIGGLKLNELLTWLPELRQQAINSPLYRKGGKRILVFSTLGYWIQHGMLLSMALSGMGHEVTQAFLPYANWQKRLGRFDLRLQNTYVRSVLSGASPAVTPVSWHGGTNGSFTLPSNLEKQIAEVSAFDVMYTEQKEEVDRSGRLYHFRQERNRHAAFQALRHMQASRPELLILPNGSILEFGAVYRAAKYLGIPTMTYEFGEQRDRIWFASNDEVMQQNTNVLWEAFQNQPLNEEEWERIRELFASRQKASLWENFSRRWQSVPSEGGERVRAALGLDERPVALLAANVIGDSLTLGRQVFSENMTEWLKQTVEGWRTRNEIQLVVRIHPGERYTKGPSVADILRDVLPELPEHIHLVAFDAPVNTYDIVQIADLGLVYTTTVGLEMAMSGVPVLVAGNTHYRNRGFTHDPQSWEEFFARLETLTADPAKSRLSREQVEQAWNYAYRFFFEFPMPFPWHLLNMPADMERWSLSRILSAEGQAVYGETFNHLVGEPRRWQLLPLDQEQV